MILACRLSTNSLVFPFQKTVNRFEPRISLGVRASFRKSGLTLVS